mmetsp:Transcript_19852/g.61647  ORF Transcript_19852/g.61647 Transcript_19852/m.61647 type:complete len:251 (-) Transcript_19852:132-884(-)
MLRMLYVARSVVRTCTTMSSLRLKRSSAVTRPKSSTRMSAPAYPRVTDGSGATTWQACTSLKQAPSSTTKRGGSAIAAMGGKSGMSSFCISMKTRSAASGCASGNRSTEGAMPTGRVPSTVTSTTETPLVATSAGISGAYPVLSGTGSDTQYSSRRGNCSVARKRMGRTACAVATGATAALVDAPAGPSPPTSSASLGSSGAGSVVAHWYMSVLRSCATTGFGTTGRLTKCASPAFDSGESTPGDGMLES